MQGETAKVIPLYPGSFGVSAQAPVSGVGGMVISSGTYSGGAYIVHQDVHPVGFVYYGTNTWPENSSITGGSATNAPYQVPESVMSDTPSREEIDAKLGKIGAETDTKIARIEGKLDGLLQKMDYVLKDSAETRLTIREEARSGREITWVVGLGIVAILIAIFTLFPVIFDMGSKNHDAMDASVKAYLDHARQIATP